MIPWLLLKLRNVGTVADKMRDYLGRLIQPSENQSNQAIRAALQSSPGDYQPVAVSGTFVEPQALAQPFTKSAYVKSKYFSDALDIRDTAASMSLRGVRIHTRRFLICHPLQKRMGEPFKESP